MDNKSASIKAIIFVTIYILFIFFISLFKGLYFKDLKLHNLYIKSLFIKIDKKLILKANSITIIPRQKVSQDITSIHKTIFYISKIIPIFEELQLKNIKYKNISIPLFEYKNKKIFIHSNFIKLSGIIYPFKSSTIIINLNLQYKNIKIDRINGKIDFNKTIFLKLSAFYDKNKININAKLDANDNIHLKLYSKRINIIYKKYKLNINHFTLTLFTNLHYLKLTANITAKNFVLNKNIFLKDIKTVYNNSSVKFDIKEIKIKKIKDFSNLFITTLKGTYFIPDKLLIISRNKSASLNYKNTYLKLNNNYLIFKNLNNFDFITNDIFAKYKNFIFKSSKGYVLKFNNFLLVEVSNNFIKNRIINIYNDIVYIYKNKIEIPKVKIRYKNIKIKITNSLINTKIKKAVIEKIDINKFLFTPTYLILKNNILNIKTYSSNILINKNFNSILRDFNITNPIIQIHGKNFLKATTDINIKTKDYNFTVNVLSKNSVFKFKNIMFAYDKLDGNVTKQKFKANVMNLNTSFDFFKADLDANLTVTPSYLNAFSLIKMLKVLNFVDVKNYKEKVVIDFANKIVYFLNSNIYINILQKEIFLLQLKNLIKFTPFKQIIKNGSIFIKIAKKILINGYLQLKQPIIMNQKNPDIINALIFIDNKNIEIENSFINMKIENLKDYIAYIKNADINIKNLIKIYDELSKTLLKTSSKKETNTTFKIFSTNTNFIYENHKFLSQKAKLIYDKNFNIYSKYKQSILKGYTKQGYFLLEGNHYQKEELVPLLSFFNHFKSIDLDFILVKSPDGFFTGKVYINRGIINELTALNNIIAFLNTIPSILSLSSPGFSAKGYKIKNGMISYLYYQNILYFKQIKIIGQNIDFYGKGYINLNNNTINLKINAVLKMKLKKIPIIGKGLSYILFGKDGNINVKIVVKGNINNPKVSQDIGKSIILTPFELFKRVLTLPFHLF
ncbi:YhdP family protein [Caminibacter sp.]